MFCEESLGKINKCDLELFRNGSVFEFYRMKELITLEQVNTSVVGKKRTILISKGKLIGCCKLLLYANKSYNEHAVYFRQ